MAGFKKLAKKHAIAVIGSFRETFSPKPRNTAIAISRNGEILATYAKIHLFTPGNEDQAFTPGNELATFTLEGVHIGLAICYDLRFPEIFRLYRRKGIHAVIVPAAWPQSRLRHWELFIQSRAAENQMYVAGVNTTGTNPVDQYAGASMTADPHGNIIARAGEGNELLYYEIDPRPWSRPDRISRRIMTAGTHCTVLSWKNVRRSSHLFNARLYVPGKPIDDHVPSRMRSLRCHLSRGRDHL